MALFKKTPASTSLPISDFWVWWNGEGKSAFTRAIDAKSFGSLPDVISGYVERIDSDLVWETGKGTSSQHELTVSANGVPQLRGKAERWLRAAPPADEVWQYSAFKGRSPESMASRLEIAGAKVELDQTRFSAEVIDERGRLDVTVYNPAFASMPQQAAMQVAFLTLDWTLGEDDVGRWVGPVATTTTARADALTSKQLAEVADRFASERGEDNWSLLTFRSKSGSRGVASVETAVRWLDYPTFDLHTAIEISYPDKTSEGLPGPKSLEQLRDFEDQLIQVVGVRGVLMAHQTAEGVRVFHVYSDSEDQNATDAIKSIRSSAGKTKQRQKLDPGWSEVRHLTG